MIKYGYNYKDQKEEVLRVEEEGPKLSNQKKSIQVIGNDDPHTAELQKQLMGMSLRLPLNTGSNSRGASVKSGHRDTQSSTSFSNISKHLYPSFMVIYRS